MNWPRVKMILIILFLCINIFLLYNMFSSSWRSSSIDKQTVANVVEILSKNGIRINGDLIAPRVKAMKSVIPDLLEKGYQLVTVSDLYKYGRLS